jgi:predicted RNase H-like nuclease (RuvC/YqgF family)
MKHEEVLTRSSLEKTSLDRTLTKLEEDNGDLQRQVNQLQQTLASLEQEHSSR